MNTNSVPRPDPVNDTNGRILAVTVSAAVDQRTLLLERVAEYEQAPLPITNPFGVLWRLMQAELFRDTYKLEDLVRQHLTARATTAECLQQTEPFMTKYLAAARRITRNASQEVRRAACSARRAVSYSGADEEGR